jgi:hypothetical protein
MLGIIDLENEVGTVPIGSSFVLAAVHNTTASASKT